MLEIIVIPGSFALVSTYLGYEGPDIWCKDFKETPAEAEWIVAHSAGVNYLLSKPLRSAQKIILVNPIVKKRSLLDLLVREIRFVIGEGTKSVDLVPVLNWAHSLLLELGLVKIDVLRRMRELSRENVWIIKGNRDRYFCDQEDVAILRHEGFKVFEADAGHCWNRNIDQKVREIISST